MPTLVPATGVPPLSLDRLAPVAGVPGVRGRTVAALDVTLDDLTFALSPALGAPLSGAGLRGGTFRLRRGAIVLRGLRVVPGVRVSGEAAAARQRPPADLRRPGGGRPGAGLAERRGARAARRPAGARAAAGGAAAAGGERCADRREVGAVPAQSGLFFRPTPVVAFSFPPPSDPAVPRKL